MTWILALTTATPEPPPDLDEMHSFEQWMLWTSLAMPLLFSPIG
jgi:hypothetical protein